MVTGRFRIRIAVVKNEAYKREDSANVITVLSVSIRTVLQQATELAIEFKSFQCLRIFIDTHLVLGLLPSTVPHSLVCYIILYKARVSSSPYFDMSQCPSIDKLKALDGITVKNVNQLVVLGRGIPAYETLNVDVNGVRTPEIHLVKLINTGAPGSNEGQDSDQFSSRFHYREISRARGQTAGVKG